jgi:hypothetical protein
MVHSDENYESRDRVGTEDLLGRTAPAETAPEEEVPAQGTSAEDNARGDLAGADRRTEPATPDTGQVDDHAADQVSDHGADNQANRGANHRVSQADEHAELIESADSSRFRERWHEVQAAFVDDPQRAVSDADQLVAELMQTLAATFAERKQALEGQWQKGNEAETEDLRLALRSYRSFFDQLLPH